MPASSAALAALRKFLQFKDEAAVRAAREKLYHAQAESNVPAKVPTMAEWWQQVPEQRMLQGLYRGYAGDYDAARAAQDAGLIYATPQRRAAEMYAASRSKQAARRGDDSTPHVEMVLIDPATGRRYGHSTMGTGSQPPLRTLAAELKPEDVKSTTQLYARGGLAQLKECSCHKT